MLVYRKRYMDWLLANKDRQIIKVVTGVRRCGKSTLLEQFCHHLQESGVGKERIIFINFEDLAYEDLLDYRTLYAYIAGRLAPDGMSYIFLDEIQHVREFQKAVDSLFIKPNCDIYITGSNAYLMSSDLATLLTGRYIELSMLPFSFAEYREAESARGLDGRALLERYINWGAFPYLTRYEFGLDDAREYLDGLYNTILIHDVANRLKVSDIGMLDSLACFLLHNVGNLVSPASIAHAMTSAGRKIDPKTVERHINGLCDCLMFYKARKYDLRGKALLATGCKCFACDVALRNTKVKGRESDIGHLLENIVYLELRRRFNAVYVGCAPGQEVDFVAVRNGAPSYFQVAATTLDEAVLSRELAPLRAIRDNHPKTLLTLDEVFGEMDYDGIRKTNLIRWLEE